MYNHTKTWVGPVVKTAGVSDGNSASGVEAVRVLMYYIARHGMFVNEELVIAGRVSIYNTSICGMLNLSVALIMHPVGLTWIGDFCPTLERNTRYSLRQLENWAALGCRKPLEDLLRWGPCLRFECHRHIEKLWSASIAGVTSLGVLEAPLSVVCRRYPCHYFLFRQH